MANPIPDQTPEASTPGEETPTTNDTIIEEQVEVTFDEATAENLIVTPAGTTTPADDTLIQPDTVVVITPPPPTGFGCGTIFAKIKQNLAGFFSLLSIPALGLPKPLQNTSGRILVWGLLISLGILILSFTPPAVTALVIQILFFGYIGYVIVRTIVRLARGDTSAIAGLGCLLPIIATIAACGMIWLAFQAKPAVQEYQEERIEAQVVATFEVVEAQSLDTRANLWHEACSATEANGTFTNQSEGCARYRTTCGTDISAQQYKSPECQTMLGS